MALSSGSIEVAGVGKRFVLSRRRPDGPARGSLGTVRAPRRLPPDATNSGRSTTFRFPWRPGEALGIVGHNGSGKSTMLKLLTGIMKPTRGSIRVGGRVGALIEVGGRASIPT
jgi:ABC-type polysaccharide/polyol phosphate transport system ATPase subunit